MNTTTTAKTAHAELVAMTAEQPTATLLAALSVIEDKGRQTQAERLTAAVISDTISNRYDLDATIEAVYFADDFEGTYFDAIVLAMAVKGVEV